jgi:FtsZ-interacting cell division protein ZipA
MGAGVIVAIVLGAIVVIALVALLAKRGSETRRENKRVEAHETRREAQVHGARAEKASAHADERAARARGEQAEAQEASAVADRERRASKERHEYAEDIDPDS